VKCRGLSSWLCYEAGFSGFSAQRLLSERGLDCRVVNHSRRLTTNNKEAAENDKIDARNCVNIYKAKK